MTLQDSLRELVEKWRSRTKGQFFPNAAESSVSWGRNDCADELESLLAAQPPAEPAPTVKLMDLEQKVLGILDELTPEDADVSHPCHQAYQRIGKLFNDALLLAQPAPSQPPAPYRQWESEGDRQPSWDDCEQSSSKEELRSKIAHVIYEKREEKDSRGFGTSANDIADAVMSVILSQPPATEPGKELVERAEKLFWKLVSIHSTNNASSVREIAFEFAKVRDETLEEAAKRAPHQIAYNIRALKLGQSGGGK